MRITDRNKTQEAAGKSDPAASCVFVTEITDIDTD